MSTPTSAPELSERTSCRVCGSSPLVPVMNLGDQCIAGLFPKPGDEGIYEKRFPLDLVRCDRSAQADACGLLQLRTSVRPDVLYSSYWYRSGINRTMTQNLHEIASRAQGLVGGLNPGDLVLDIGCNDGTLLDGHKALAPEGVRYLGIDPSDVTRYAVAKGYDVINDLFTADALQRHLPGARAKVITSIAMFYDLEDPVGFARDVEASLTDDGVWIAEFSYMPTMLAMNSLDTICHEHLEYYSLSVVERLLKLASMQILRADLNDVNGGSIRFYAGKIGSREPLPEHRDQLDALRAEEERLGLDSSEPYVRFAQRAAAIRDELVTLLRNLRADGSVVHVYGASTKGNVLLQYAGIDTSLVAVAADRNPDKWGLETIGTHIPIVSEEESRAANPDYYLVLPWHFLDEMLEREAEFLARGGRFIVPFPRVRIVDAAGR